MKFLKLVVFSAVFLVIPSIFPMDWESTEPIYWLSKKAKGIAMVRKAMNDENYRLILERIEQGAPVNMEVDENGNTLLHYFLNQVIKEKERTHGSIALPTYAKGIGNSIRPKEAVKYLIKQYGKEGDPNLNETYGMLNVNAQNSEGDTPLILAVFLGDPDIIGRLIDSGADKSITNDAGDTPYDFAKKNEDIDQEILDLLEPNYMEMDED
ncbi:MAG TPA: ankyrin repeat domain-containing protein [Candidatus Bathyarchaeia archaeon]|nr:ankyrin repeat domain-containing protein [Candidatus Bathyarchaeia archaeon]